MAARGGAIYHVLANGGDVCQLLSVLRRGIVPTAADLYGACCGGRGKAVCALLNWRSARGEGLPLHYVCAVHCANDMQFGRLARGFVSHAGHVQKAPASGHQRSVQCT